MLPPAIKRLSQAEKLELLDALLENLAADTSTMTAEQSRELDHRVAAYDQNKLNVIPWDHVQADQAQATQLASFNQELGRRLDSLERGESIRPEQAQALLREKSKQRRA